MNVVGALPNVAWLLANFTTEVPGIAHAVALSADGLLLASSPALPPERAEQLASVAAGVVSLAVGTASHFDGGRLRQTIVEVEAGFLVLMSVGDGSSLAILAGSACDLGQIGYEMTLLVDRVGSALAPSPRTAAVAAP